ncbi:hypothetical protein D3C74_429640 [compost metagenome]
MQNNPPLTAIGGDGLKLSIIRQLAADLALRQLQEQTGNVLSNVPHIIQRNETVFVCKQNRLDMVQLLQPVLLMNLQMAQRMISDSLEPFAVTPDPESNLLSHSSAREEHR